MNSRLHASEEELSATTTETFGSGPEALTKASEDWLYFAGGLAAAREALRAGGVLAVGSVKSSPEFVGLTRRARFTVEQHRPRARGNKGPRHGVWIATRW